MLSVWDKKSNINNLSAERFLDRHKFLRKESTIYIETVNGKVSLVAGKSILSNNYGIDPTLPDNEFIAEYERIINTPPEEETNLDGEEV